MTKAQIEKELKKLRPDWTESRIQQGVEELYLRQQQRRSGKKSEVKSETKS